MQRENYRQKRDAIRELKRRPCQSCGNTYHPVAMHFHHRDPSTKIDNVSNMLRGYSMDVILREIDKCDLLCAICHSVETEQQRMLEAA